MTYRVKLYKLDQNGAWDDKGTGYVCITEHENLNTIQVSKEQDSSNLLLNVKLIDDDVYQRQQETLIVWTEPDGENLALSFQEAEGCNEIWDQIATIQRKLMLLSGDFVNNAMEDEYNSQLNFPPPEPSNLKDIEQSFLSASRSVIGRDNAIASIIEQKYIDKLVELFEKVEKSYMDLENEKSLDNLFTMSNIIKSILFLNDASIFTLILQENVFLNIVGMLEYDRDFSTAKANHRQHLLHHAQFKEIVPMEKHIVDKIKLTYRVQFLKDVVLARLLDDGTFSLLNSFAHMNHYEIVSYIQENEEFLKNLFSIWTDQNKSEESKNDVVLFLREYCSIAKGLQFAHRTAFYRSLCHHGLFTIFSSSLNNSQLAIRIAATAVLSNVLEHDPSLVRSYTLAQIRQSQPNLIFQVIERLHDEPDAGVRSQYSEILRILIDGPKNDGVIEKIVTPHDSEIDEFLNFFYKTETADMLMKPLINLPEKSKFSFSSGIERLDISRDEASICNHLCEILCFSVKNHSYRSKYYILASPLMNGVLLLLKCKESYIRLSALRFFRTCVGMKDEFYNRHLLKLDIFGPIIQAFNETKSKYNLFNSACLEFFEFIRKENIKTLINYIGEKYSKSFDDVDYIDTFSSIILKYEQSKDPCSGLDEKENSESISFSQKLEKDGWSKVDKSEEDYFNTSDEEENESTTPQTSSVIKDSSLSVATSPHLSNSLTLGVGGLVENYPDDEEEEEFPLRKKVLVVKSNSPTTNIFSNLNKNKFKSSININNNTSISKTVKSSSVIDIGNNVKVKNIYGSDDNNLQADSETFLNDDNDNSNLTSSNKTANCNLKRQRI